MRTAHRKTCWRFGIAGGASTMLALTGILVGVLQSGAGLRAQDKPAIDVKLGLWETTVTGQSQGMPSIDTSNMTPEQKARVEALLQAQQARGNTPRTTTSKSCLTKEKLEKGFLDDAVRQRQVDCKQTIVSNSSTELHMKAECTAQGRGMTGDFHFVALSRESVQGEFSMALGGDGGGRGMTIKSSMMSKWLSADCGDVK